MTERPDQPPTSYDEFLDRFHKNQKITGFGIGNVYSHAPCPFCAAPEFMVFEIMDTETVMVRDHTCQECKRSGKFLLDKLINNISFRFVQTGGPDLPSWMPFTMERINTEEGRT